MKRFPSLATAVRDARATANRFPLALLAGLGAMVVTLLLIEHEEDSHPRLLTTFILGLPLFTASVTTAERRGIPAGRRWLVDLAIAAALLLLYQGSLGWSEQHAVLRFAQLLIAAHLLVAIAPYLGSRDRQGFWQYNRFLLLRYLVAGFYAAVLFLGLALALGALDKLFGADVPGEAYGRLFAVLAFGFHPWPQAVADTSKSYFDVFDSTGAYLGPVTAPYRLNEWGMQSWTRDALIALIEDGEGRPTVVRLTLGVPGRSR